MVAVEVTTSPLSERCTAPSRFSEHLSPAVVDTGLLKIAAEVKARGTGGTTLLSAQPR